MVVAVELSGFLLLFPNTCLPCLGFVPSIGKMASLSPAQLRARLDGDDDDDDEPPEVDVSKFKPPIASFGLHNGRSSPSQRKAMGTSGSSAASVHICSTCGSESVKWLGRCPTCKEWNTLQEHTVTRQPASFGTMLGGANLRPSFGAGRLPSWLDGIDAMDKTDFAMPNKPVRITNLYKSAVTDDGVSSHEHNYSRRPQRLWIPGDGELNTVLGGGIMQGSLTLIGGEPGVGKSTLLLQIAGSVASLSTPTPAIGMGPAKHRNTSSPIADLGPVWYVSGEENPDQIASRAERLGIHESELFLLSETHADTLCELVVSHFSGRTQLDDDDVPRRKPPALIIIDSIQTIVCNAGGPSAAGGITQVRESVALFLRLAKSTGIPLFLVGHVTKAGDVAGPRTVEHVSRSVDGDVAVQMIYRF
jgi:DNA repair protein RadA/Sms